MRPRTYEEQMADLKRMREFMMTLPEDVRYKIAAWLDAEDGIHSGRNGFQIAMQLRAISQGIEMLLPVTPPKVSCCDIDERRD
jgi:hypothetical protein